MANNPISDARQNLADEAAKSAKFFEVDISIRIFGHEILHLHFPPQNSKS